MISQTLVYAAPAPSLSQFIAFFYEFQSLTNVFDDVDRADYGHIRFILKGRGGQYTFIDGHTQSMPEVHIVGPTTGCVRIRGEGGLHVFGIRLTPAGWGIIMPMAASAAVNRVYDASELFGALFAQTMKDLAEAATMEDRLAAGNRLIERLNPYKNVAILDFTARVDQWLATSLSADINALVALAGISRRQVERNCNRYYGASPKLLARIHRASRITAKLANGEADVKDLVEHGYYDQSHLIRELKYFTGLTPTTIREKLPTLTKLTLRRAMYDDENALDESTSGKPST